MLQEVAPRSYTVLTDAGTIVRRNRIQLLKSRNQSSQAENAFSSDGHVAVEEQHETGDAQTLMDSPESLGGVQGLRRSERTRKPPERLNL